MTAYRALFQIADNAKNNGLYEIANIVFAILITAAKASSQLKVEYESDNGEAELGYYDLLVVREVKGDGYLCIPIPLIRPDLIKEVDFKIVDRGQHARLAEVNPSREKNDAKRQYLLREVKRQLVANKKLALIRGCLDNLSGEGIRGIYNVLPAVPSNAQVKSHCDPEQIWDYNQRNQRRRA